MGEYTEINRIQIESKNVNILLRGRELSEIEADIAIAIANGYQYYGDLIIGQDLGRAYIQTMSLPNNGVKPTSQDAEKI